MNELNDNLDLSKEFLGKYRDADPGLILRALMADIPKYLSWGARSAVNLFGKGLRITVSGFKHKGWVYVLLNGSDLFDVYLTTNRGKITKIIRDVGVENLSETVDLAVEFTGASYESLVRKSLVSKSDPEVQEEQEAEYQMEDKYL